MMRFFMAAALAWAVLWSQAAAGEIVLVDVTGAPVRLARPAARVVSLAPHLTENLFAIGAGDLIVGTVQYSDHPEAARRLPRVGGYSRLDLEAVAALKPDLVVAWQTGNGAAELEKIRGLGIPVFVTQADRIEQVAADLERLGRLTGREAGAQAAAQAFRRRLAGLRQRYAERLPVRTFYEVWHQPLMTVGGGQIISDAIRVCGGDNIFAGLTALAPQVSEEAVVAADPEAIVASGMGEARPDWLDNWRRWTALTAVARGNLFFIPPDLLQRHTPRLLDGTEMLCRHLETARERRQ